MPDPVADDGELVAVTTWIRRDRIAEFQTIAATFAQPGQSAAAAADDSPRVGTWDLPPWRSEDVDRARTVVSRLNDTQHGLLAALLEATAPVTSEDLAQQLGLGSARSVPALLKSIATWCRKVDRRPCWDPFRGDDRRYSYSFDDSTRAAFADAIRASSERN